MKQQLLVVEALSPSTADFDRGGKFSHYRQIQCLQEYLVLSQDEPRAEQHTRTDDGLWLLREVIGVGQILQLASLNKPLTMRELYDKVQFAEAAT